MLSFRAERTNVARRLVNQAVPNHLVLPVKSSAAFGAGTAFYGAIVWPNTTVYVRM